MLVDDDNDDDDPNPKLPPGLGASIDNVEFSNEQIICI